IEGVSQAIADGVISEDKGKDLIGQAKFLRAITHFELNKQMARPYNHTPDASHLGVIIRDVAINSSESLEYGEENSSRSSVADVYNFVLNDLNDTESDSNNSSLTYASSDAAIAFKTRVYLHMRKWDKVIEE